MMHLEKVGSVPPFGCIMLALPLRAHQIDPYVSPLEIRRHPARPEPACGLQCFQRLDGVGTLQNPSDFFGSEGLSFGNSPQVDNVFLDIGQIFPDSMPLDSNLVELFSSTVKARLILIFLLCSFAVNSPSHIYAWVRGQTYDSQQCRPLIFNRFAIRLEKSIRDHRVQEERPGYSRAVFLHHLDYVCLQVDWEVDTEIGRALSICNKLCECVCGAVSPEPESILQCYIICQLVRIV